MGLKFSVKRAGGALYYGNCKLTEELAGTCFFPTKKKIIREIQLQHLVPARRGLKPKDVTAKVFLKGISCAVVRLITLLLNLSSFSPSVAPLPCR